jgi:hypothetical protein
LLVSHVSESNQTESYADSEGDIRAVPLQIQPACRVEEVEDMDSAMCGLSGADHGDGHYEFGGKLLGEERMYHATPITTLDSATNQLLDGSSQGEYSSRL